MKQIQTLPQIDEDNNDVLAMIGLKIMGFLAILDILQNSEAKRPPLKANRLMVKC